MAVTKVKEIIGRAEKILNDDSAIRWTRLELQDWLNDAYKEIILLRPDANAQTANVTLAAGTRQKLSDPSSINLPGATRILDVVRNMASTSNKKAVSLVSRRILDEQYPLWHSTTGGVNITHWMFDLRAPKEFLVYPPASTSAQLEILYASVPTPHTLDEAGLDPAGSDTSVIKIDDVYANAILDYILYRAYSKDAEYAANAARAQSHGAAFAGSLNAKSTIDGATTQVASTGRGA